MNTLKIFSFCLIAMIVTVIVTLQVDDRLKGNSTANAEQPKEPEPYDPKFIRVKVLKHGDLGIQITTIDSCQYIIMANEKTSSIVHKENCVNPEHKNELTFQVKK